MSFKKDPEQNLMMGEIEEEKKTTTTKKQQQPNTNFDIKQNDVSNWWTWVSITLR